MERAKPLKRRRHAEELKRQVLAQCAEPGASVAQVALAHRLNANLVHKWRRLAGPAKPAVFVPVTVAPAPAASAVVPESIPAHGGAALARQRSVIQGAVLPLPTIWVADAADPLVSAASAASQSSTSCPSARPRAS